MSQVYGKAWLLDIILINYSSIKKLALNSVAIETTFDETKI